MNNSIVNKIIYIIVVLVLLVTINLGCKSNNDSNTLNLWDIGPITLDPAISSESTSHMYIMQMYSGLVHLDKKLNPGPGIAESWTRSEDGLTYTFSLRRGVTFHDGREVTAQDFKYSWERACNPDTGSETAAMYLNDIVGVNDMLEGRASEIKGVEVVDTYTLKVTTIAVKQYFLLKLGYPTAFVVDKKNVETSNEWWRQPNGTGPFILKEWIPGNKITLKPNNKFYGEIPKLNRVNFHILAGNPLDLYELGQIDVAPIYQAYIDKAEDPKGSFKDDLHVFPQLSMSYIGFNTSKPPFDDINIRQAFCHAINKEKIINVILGNSVIDAHSIVPPGMPGYNPDLNSLEFDINKAKELISQSTYQDVSNLPPIKLTTSGWGGNISEEMGAIIQDWQYNLGVQVTVRQLEPEIFLYRINEEVDEIYMLGWVADYADPQNFLDNLFRTGYTYNVSKYSNEEVDSLLSMAAIEQDKQKRLNIYREAEQIILLDAPILPLWFDTNYILIKPFVRNFELNPVGIPTLNEAYIEH